MLTNNTPRGSVAPLQLLVGVLLLAASACNATVADVPKSECVSGKKWTGGNQASALMRPGADCVACHARNGGPALLVGGTVYAADGLNDANDCYGIKGASVVVQDASGKSVALETNAAGNYYLLKRDGPLAFPLTVEVEYNGNIRPMTIPATTGSCASCHTAAGLNNAAGRIVVP